MVEFEVTQGPKGLQAANVGRSTTRICIPQSPVRPALLAWRAGTVLCGPSLRLPPGWSRR